MVETYFASSIIRGDYSNQIRAADCAITDEARRDDFWALLRVRNCTTLSTVLLGTLAKLSDCGVLLRHEIGIIHRVAHGIKTPLINTARTLQAKAV